MIIVNDIKENWRSILLKALAIQVAFIVLHYSYDFFPNLITKTFSGTNESTFQHLKIAFFATIFVNVVEYFIKRKQITDQNNFIFSRMAATTILPWIIFLGFYTPIAFYGQYHSVLAEIVSANVVLYASSAASILLQNHVENSQPTPAFQVMVSLLFLISFSMFIVFTYKAPWTDMFAQPPGWER